MKKSILLFAKVFIFYFFQLSIFTCAAQVPDWQWAKSAGGTGSDLGTSVCTDLNGNVYVAGDFASFTIYFGTDTFTNSGPSDIILAKYDASGNLLWAKKFGGSGNDEVNSIKTDNAGNIYMTGNFESSTIVFGTYNLYNVNLDDVYLVKLDSSGNVLWAKSAGGQGRDKSLCLALDVNKNAYITGYFQSHSINFGTITLTNADQSTTSSDIFISKYDSLGNILWAKRAGGSDYDEGTGVAMDANGNVYVTGYFWSNTISFGTTTFTNGGLSNIFLTKYDSQGNVQWAKSPGGSSYSWSMSVATDNNGDAYITGYYQTSDLTFGTTTLPAAGLTDIFLAKYDPSGNVIWAKSAGNTDNDWSYTVITDSDNNAYIAGYYKSLSIIFGSDTLYTSGPYDIYVVKYDANGNVLWTKSAIGTDTENAYDIASDFAGNIYVTGYFNSPGITFGNDTLTTVGYSDSYLAKLSATNGISESIQINSEMKIYPNPANNIITVDLPKLVLIEIMNIEGQIIKRLKIKDNKTNIDISDFSSGVYIIRAQTDTGITTEKFIKE